MRAACFAASVISLWISFFFFQAEDGIRDGHVTGVQTCALPIAARDRGDARAVGGCRLPAGRRDAIDRGSAGLRTAGATVRAAGAGDQPHAAPVRPPAVGEALTGLSGAT